MALIAVIFGGGSTLGIRTINPSTYDRFTGADGKALAERVAKLEIAQARDDDHRAAAADGWSRIRNLESWRDRTEGRAQANERTLKQLSERVRGLQ